MKTILLSDYLKDLNKFGDCALPLQKALDDIKNSGAPCTLLLPENGEIHIYKDYCHVREYHTSNTNSVEFPKKTIGILIENQKDLTVDGRGCKIIFHGDIMAVAVVHSENITLKNFSWDFANPTTSQITVKKVNKFSTVFDVAAGCDFEVKNNRVQWICGRSPYTNEPYYVEHNSHNGYTVVGYDPETGVQRRHNIFEYPFSRAVKFKKLSERELKVTYFGKPTKLGQKPGVVSQMCASRVRPTAGAFFWESKNITAESVTVHYMHGFGWLTQMCENVTFSGCKFIPDKEGRYCTSYADLIHVSGAAGKILIENCEFSYPHDDPINIHGTFTRVEKLIDKHTAQLKYIHRQQGGFPQFHEGDEVGFFARDTLAGINEEEKIYTVKSATVPGEDGNDLKTMTVVFNEELPQNLTEKIAGQPKYVAENVTYTPEVVIRNNTFDHVPTRGILCTTRKKVIIENNRFDNMAMACIFISNDSNDWYESGPVRDMTVRNNEFFIRKSGQSEWANAPAVYIHPVTKGGKLPETPVHKNITIEDNTIHLFSDKAFVIESVENLTIRNNKIIKETDSKNEVYEIKACKNVNSDL